MITEIIRERRLVSGVGDHQAGKGRRAHRVGEEGQPPQHDPGPEEATGHREQAELDQRVAQEGHLDQVERRGKRGHRRSVNENGSRFRRWRSATKSATIPAAKD